MDVGVDADILDALERQNQHEVRRLASHAGQRQQLVHRARHAAAVPLDQQTAGFLDVPCLVAVEADGIDQPLDLPDGELRHRARRARHAEQPRRRGGGHRIARLRRQHRRDEDVERIFLALFGDFLDRGQLEIVDGARERPHDRQDASRRRFRHYFG